MWSLLWVTLCDLTFYSEHKDSEKKHKEKEKTKHKDGSSEKHKDKHKDRDKEKRKEEKVQSFLVGGGRDVDALLFTFKSSYLHCIVRSLGLGVKGLLSGEFKANFSLKL